MWFSLLVGLVTKITDPAGALSKWAERRDNIAKAKADAEIAKITAEAELAAYKYKADVEWDLKWADNAQSSWKDEWLVILWSIPLVGLFLPFLRPFIMEGFVFLKQFNPEAPTWFMAGWAIIFAATFGLKQAVQLMLPSRIASLATAMGAISDDIPNSAVEKANEVLAKLKDDPEVKPKAKPKTVIDLIKGHSGENK
jgi:hypothetical protein